MTPAFFQATYLTYAGVVSAGTGILRSVLLAQWAVETGWGTTWAGYPNNLANIRCSPTTFCAYPTLGIFCEECVATWHNGFYGAVLATAATDTPEQQMVAIGKSPWDAGHYNSGGGPGSSLIAAYKELPMAATVGEQPWSTGGELQSWLTDIRKTQAVEVGTDSTTTLPVTLPQLMSAVKAIQSPPPASVDLTPVLKAIAVLQSSVDTLGSKIDTLSKHLGVGTP